MESMPRRVRAGAFNATDATLNRKPCLLRPLREVLFDLAHQLRFNEGQWILILSAVLMYQRSRPCEG